MSKVRRIRPAGVNDNEFDSMMERLTQYSSELKHILDDGKKNIRLEYQQYEQDLHASKKVLIFIYTCNIHYFN